MTSGTGNLTPPPQSGTMDTAMADESIITLTKVDHEKRNNTLVPNGDFQAFFNSISSRQAELGSPGNSLDEKYRRSLLHLMANQVEQLCQPVQDKAFFLYCKALEDQLRDEKEKRNTCDESEMVYEMTDFDDDELMDTSVLERVRALRDQVRQQARRVAEVRGDVVGRTTAITRKHLGDLADSTMQAEPTETTNDNSTEMTDQYKIYADDVERVNRAIQRMKENLTSAEEKIPDAVEKWRRQLEAIHAAEKWSLSQTEQAVRYRTKDTILPQSAPISAEERLMHFLS